MITRQQLLTLQAEITRALGPLGATHGIVITCIGGTYGQASGTIKLELAPINPDGIAETRERADFLAFAQCYGLDPADLGKTFRSSGDGGSFVITGLKLRSHKRPILAINPANGKAYVFAAETVARALKTEAR